MLVVVGVAAVGVVGDDDHLPSVLEDRIDRAAVLFVVEAVRPTDVAVASGRRGERAHPRLVVPGS
jgi:hypothetical protein